MTTLGNMQSNESKQQVRQIIADLAITLAKEQNVPLSLHGLPSTEWTFEKLMIERAKAEGVELWDIIGVENGHAEDGSAVYPIAHAAMPKRKKDEVIDLYNDDFDSFVRRELVVKQLGNVVWADYCGNPAEFKGMSVRKATGKLYPRYGYSHIETFAEVVKAANEPMLYAMTFCCNGRINGGAKAMKHALGANAASMPSAIRAKIGTTLSRMGLLDKVHELARIYYKGGKRSYMITFVFSIGCRLNVKPIKHEWVKPPKKKGKKMRIRVRVEKKTGKVSMKVVTTKAKERFSLAVRTLSDKGFDNGEIAELLHVSRSKVGSVMAWHNNRSSWE